MTVTLILIALVALIALGSKLVGDCLTRKTKPTDRAEKEYWRIEMEAKK